MDLELPPCYIFYPIFILYPFLPILRVASLMFLFFVYKWADTCIFSYFSLFLTQKAAYLIFFCTLLFFLLTLYLDSHFISIHRDLSYFIQPLSSAWVFISPILQLWAMLQWIALFLGSRILLEVLFLEVEFLPFCWLLLLHQQHLSSKANKKLLKFCIIYCSQTVGFSNIYS